MLRVWSARLTQKVTISLGFTDGDCHRAVVASLLTSTRSYCKISDFEFFDDPRKPWRSFSYLKPFLDKYLGTKILRHTDVLTDE